MIRDDQDVTEEWFVRVDGREYGPANIDTLREWKAEGRVLPANEARPADAELWTLAAEIPGLFDGEPLATADARQLNRLISPNSFRRCYRPAASITFWLRRFGYMREVFFNSFPLRSW